jgi:hypothetical protein
MAAICSKCLRTVVEESVRCGSCGGEVVGLDADEDGAAASDIEYSARSLPRLFEDLAPNVPLHSDNDR